MSNRIETILIYVACLRLGAVVVPLDTRSAHEELLDLVSRTRPTAYLGEPDVYERFADVAGSLVPLAARVLTDPPGDHPGPVGWGEFVAGGDAADIVDVSHESDRPAMLLATSGTSGRRKLVVWSHGTIANLQASASGRGIDRDAVVTVFTPMTHAAGAYFTLASLAGGAVPVLLPKFDSGVVLDAVQRHQATGIFGLPFMYAELVREQRVRPRNVGSLRAATVSGDVCPAEVEDAFGPVFGLPLRSFWASTEEVGATVTADRVGPFFRTLPQTRAQVVDPDGAPVVWGEAGQLMVSSPTTTPGYWTDENRVEPMRGRTFRSGDLVSQIGDDVFRYVGRVKDLIVRGGSNISPTEVEDVLRTHPDVSDVGVAGYPDPTLGERVGAVVVLNDPDPASAVEDIISWTREQLADHKVPERLVRADAVPRNALTKIDRVEVTRYLVEFGTRPRA